MDKVHKSSDSECRCFVMRNKPAVLCPFSGLRFQLISLLLLIYPEYSFVSHFAQHCTHAQGFHDLSKPRVAWSMVHHWHLHGHHENVHVTHEPVFSSLPPYHMLLQALIMSLNEICVAKPKTLMFAHCSIADIFKFDKPIISRNKQTSDSQWQNA
jgi:hypothetical protein